ncbi:MAG TPA: PEP-CTERM sorting domain-containing protein [Acidobacteriaceae bacterium]
MGDEFGVDNIIVSASAPTPSAVPEPGTMLLLGTGLLGTLTAAGRRSRKA